jgi:hypothetical protein
MRSIIRFTVTGITRDELEGKICKYLSKYLSVEKESLQELEELVDIEMNVSIGEAAPGDFYYSSDCIIRVR